MMNSSIDSSDLRLLQPEAIWLEPEHFELAVEISDRVAGETHQWQTYLNTLGLCGFEQWIGDRSLNVQCDRDNCSIFEPKYANAIEAVCHLKLGEFNLCLIVTESLLDETVVIPRAAIDLPEFAAHFYVIIEILEEEEQAIVRGFVRGDRLNDYRESVHLQPQGDWTYHFPLSLFDLEPDRLLFYARFSDASAIALPVATPAMTGSISPNALEGLLSGLQSPEARLWQILNWDRGSVVLTRPDLLDVYHDRLQQLQERETPSAIAAVTQSLVNLNEWLHGVFETGWETVETLLTPLEPSAVRGRRSQQTANLDAIAPVIRLLQPDRPEETRCQAAGVLGEIGEGNPDAIEALTELLQTAREEETRWQAALSLGKIDPGNPQSGVRKARLIDLGMQLAGQSVALIVAIMPKPNGRIGVFLQVQPSGNLTKLPPHLKLSVLSESGETRLEAEARSDDEGRGIDNALERRFSPPPGTRFRVRIALEDAIVTEDFIA